MFYITKWTQQTRPDIDADKYKQNKTLAVPNAINKN